MDLSDKYYTDLLPHTADTSTTEQYVNKMVQHLFAFLAQSSDRKEKIVEFVKPEQLSQIIDFTLPEEGTSLESVLKIVSQILKYVVKTTHPREYNQLWAGLDTTGLMGDWMTSATNTTMFSYEMSPVYVVIEKFVIEKFCETFGYGQEGEGFFFPGGSTCNLEAIVLARHRKYPSIKETGMYGVKRMVIFASEEGHYSIKKSVAMLGLGTKNIIPVQTDKNGRLIPSELDLKIKTAIEEGAEPLFVCATAGTTVGGAYDKFNEIADICRKYNIWLHIDGCWGGSCVFSNKHKHNMQGCHRADSISWDPHKMLNVTQQCAVLLTKTKGDLMSQNCSNASYLFQKDKRLYNVEWDTGDKTFQCGRHNDVLKFWLMWKAKGAKGIEKQVDLVFSNARYLADAVLKRDDFQLLREPSCGNVCFRYIPPSLKNCENREERLSEICPVIKERMTLAGSLLIGYQPLKEHGNFFRMITTNPASRPEDMIFILDEIARLGADL